MGEEDNNPQVPESPSPSDQEAPPVPAAQPAPESRQAPPPPVMSGGMNENTWAMVVHLAALAGCLIPCGNIIGPLIAWIIKKDEMPSIDRHGKAALNFNITITIYFGVAFAISFILLFVFIGMLLMPIVVLAFYVVMILFPILAGLKANEGGWYEYPMTIYFIK